MKSAIYQFFERRNGSWGSNKLILKGAKSADPPVEQSPEFEFIINLREFDISIDQR